MESATGERKKLSSSAIAHPGHLFSLEEIKLATNNFSYYHLIGEGRIGRVYKGQISSKASRVVAIKRFYRMTISPRENLEFKAELDMLCRLRYRHLVSLLGYCDVEKEIYLVYEYMPNGSLKNHLLNSHAPLSWVARLKIALGAARGLNFLHTGLGTQNGITHGDVNCSNIFLDENWVAMILDFGLSKIYQINQRFFSSNSRVYIDPHYISTGIYTMKSDVYAFGVVLFQLLSGRLDFAKPNEGNQFSLIRWARKFVKGREFNLMVDSNIKETISTKCLTQFAQIADDCMHNDPKKRPTMSELVTSLQALLELQEKSKRSEDSSTKPNSEQTGTSSQKGLDNKKDQHEE